MHPFKLRSTIDEVRIISKIRVVVNFLYLSLMGRLSFILLLALILFNSCGKDGCTDETAVNYCKKCKHTDNSCLYNSQVIFWHNQATNDSLLAHNVVYLTYLVKGIIIKQFYLPNTVSSSPPDCGTIGMASTSRTLKINQSQMDYYEIKDDKGNRLWDGYVDFETYSPCIIIQQEYKP